MPDIIDRLESHNQFCMPSDTRQVLKDAAEKMRKLKRALEALVDIAPESVEYGDWPELQEAVNNAREALEA